MYPIKALSSPDAAVWASTPYEKQISLIACPVGYVCGDRHLIVDPDAACSNRREFDRLS